MKEEMKIQTLVDLHTTADIVHDVRSILEEARRLSVRAVNSTMVLYIRMFDDLKRGEGDNPTIGILMCAEKDETVVKYSVLEDSRQIFASKYLPYLPSEEEIRRELEQRPMIEE